MDFDNLLPLGTEKNLKEFNEFIEGIEGKLSDQNSDISKELNKTIVDFKLRLPPRPNS